MDMDMVQLPKTKSKRIFLSFYRNNCILKINVDTVALQAIYNKLFFNLAYQGQTSFCIPFHIYVQIMMAVLG
jgi:hypothetical protein